jgi:tellurite methyltransferase
VPSALRKTRIGEPNRGERMDPLKPAKLIRDFENLFSPEDPEGRIIDLACGEGHNGLFLAMKGCRVILADRSEESLQRARKLAAGVGVQVAFWRVDLEEEGVNPLEGRTYDGILVFRYLHRPLLPSIKKALNPGGILIYETYTIEQAQYGKPRNPKHLLEPGELRRWFGDWEVLHYHEGILPDPTRAMAGIVCRKTVISNQ